MTSLPLSYRIMPHAVKLDVPEFADWCPDDAMTLAPEPIACERWFDDFVGKLIEARSRRYLPVCRLSDGEFRFLLGPQPPDLRLPPLARWRARLAEARALLCSAGGFSAQTRGRYHSGEYTWAEWRRGRPQFSRDLLRLAERGILAMHLSYVDVPFQEHYFPALGRWIARGHIRLTSQNIVPFYFVYAALAGTRGREILAGRVLVVNSGGGATRNAIEAGLRRCGAADIVWVSISERRSLFDRIQVNELRGRVDIAVVGAGIGKANILLQLEPLEVPCVDAGFMFSVWANPATAVERPFCLTDSERRMTGAATHDPDGGPPTNRSCRSA